MGQFTKATKGIGHFSGGGRNARKWLRKGPKEANMSHFTQGGEPKANLREQTPKASLSNTSDGGTLRRKVHCDVQCNICGPIILPRPG